MKQLRNVVMLPTNEASLNGKQIYLKDKLVLPITGAEARRLHNHSYKPQHLYLTSDEEIKEGDWVFCSTIKSIYQWTATHIKLVINIPNSVKKIIVTTDKSLLFTRPEDYDRRGSAYEAKYQLPQIPDSFIPVYIKAYNEGKPIVEVLVEYDGFEGNAHSSEPYKNPNYGKLKLREDNTVILSSAKTYSREEMIEFGKKCGTIGTMAERIGEDYNHLFLQLVEQNL